MTGSAVPPGVLSWEIKCPSLMRGVLRELTVPDEDILADPKLAHRGTTLDRLLDNLWIETIDPGPYTEKAHAFANGRPVWREVAEGDRLEILRDVRVHSYPHGHEYDVRIKCPGCGNKISRTLDISRADLPCRGCGEAKTDCNVCRGTGENHDAFIRVQFLSEESSAKIKDGELFEFVTPRTKRTISFDILRSRDSASLALLRKGNEAQQMRAALSYRIKKLDGLADDVAIRKFVKGLSSGEAQAIRDEFDRVDCGLHMGIDWECDACQRLWTRDLEFRENFLLPSSRSRDARSG